MHDYDQLRFRLVNEDGKKTFPAGKPAVGQLIVYAPQKVSFGCMVLTVQGESIFLEEEPTILQKGRVSYDFSFNQPLRLGGHHAFTDSDNFGTVRIFRSRNWKKRIKRLSAESIIESGGWSGHFEVGYKVLTDVTIGRISEDSFVFEYRRIFPLILMMLSWAFMVFLTGLNWYYLLPAVLLLFAVEHRITHNAYFASLDNRVFMDSDGQTFMEVKPCNEITKFLDSKIRFCIEKRTTPGTIMDRDVVFDKWREVAKNVQQVSGRYRIASPVPELGHSVKTRFKKGDRMIWKLTLCYPRGLLRDLIYHLELDAAYQMEGKKDKYLPPSL